MASNKRSDKKISRIEVDRKACIGAATCVVVAPDAFDLDTENIAVIKTGAQNLDDDKLLMAAQACPVLAISLFDKDGNKIFPPNA